MGAVQTQPPRGRKGLLREGVEVLALVLGDSQHTSLSHLRQQSRHTLDSQTLTRRAGLGHIRGDILDAALHPLRDSRLDALIGNLLRSRLALGGVLLHHLLNALVEKGHHLGVTNLGIVGTSALKTLTNGHLVVSHSINPFSVGRHPLITYQILTPFSRTRLSSGGAFPLSLSVFIIPQVWYLVKGVLVFLQKFFSRGSQTSSPFLAPLGGFSVAYALSPLTLIIILSFREKARWQNKQNKCEKIILIV